MFPGRRISSRRAFSCQPSGSTGTGAAGTTSAQKMRPMYQALGRWTERTLRAHTSAVRAGRSRSQGCDPTLPMSAPARSEAGTRDTGLTRGPAVLSPTHASDTNGPLANSGIPAGVYRNSGDFPYEGTVHGFNTRHRPPRTDSRTGRQAPETVADRP